MNFMKEHIEQMEKGNKYFVPGEIMERHYYECGICEHVETLYEDPDGLSLRRCSLYSENCKIHGLTFYGKMLWVGKSKEWPRLTCNKIVNIPQTERVI